MRSVSMSAAESCVSSFSADRTRMCNSAKKNLRLAGRKKFRLCCHNCDNKKKFFGQKKNLKIQCHCSITQVDTLMEYLLAILDTPTKLDLLQDVRLLLHPAHVAHFDSLAPYHKMANPPPGFTKQVNKKQCRKTVWHCGCDLPPLCKT